MELTSMKNIGAEMERKLKSIGIKSAEDLTATGAQEAFFRLKSAYPNVCLVHLYSLQGAIENIEFNQLPEDVKEKLKAFSDGINGN